MSTLDEENDNGEMISEQGKITEVSREKNNSVLTVEISRNKKTMVVVPKNFAFCWAMVGDLISWIIKNDENNDDILITPPLIIPGKSPGNVKKYLKQARASPTTVREIDKILTLNGNADFFEVLCDLSLPERGTDAFKMFGNGPCLDAIWKWYKQQTLRRIYNLQIKKRELKGSFLNPNQFYNLICADPFLIPTIDVEKAALIKNIFGMRDSKTGRRAGSIIRESQEQLEKFGNLGVSVRFLETRHKNFDKYEKYIIDNEAAVIVNRGEQKAPLFCLKGVYRIIENVVDCLKRQKVDVTPIENIELNDEKLDDTQVDTIRQALINDIFIISGEAGTGKTRLVVEIAHQFNIRGYKTRIAVFTGKATVRVKEAFEAVGLESLIEEDENSGKNAEIPVTTIHRMIFKRISRSSRPDVLIFDEASTISTFLFGYLINRNPWIRGCKLIFSGDPNQLPPIDHGQLFQQLIQSSIPRVFLTTNFRFQGAGDEVAKLAKWVLDSKPGCGRDEIPNFPDFPSSKVNFIDGDLGIVQQLLTKLIREDKVDIGELKVICPFRKDVHFLNNFIRSLLYDEDILSVKVQNRIFSVGERVMMTINDYNNNIFNGEEGIVSSVKDPDRKSELSVEFRGIHAKVVEFFDIPARKNYDDDDDEERSDKIEDDRASVAELEYAYALTVYKSQGSEWKNVILYLPNFDTELINNNLIDTAVTRAREKIWIICTDARFIKYTQNCLPNNIDPTSFLIDQE